MFACFRKTVQAPLADTSMPYSLFVFCIFVVGRTMGYKQKLNNMQQASGPIRTSNLANSRNLGRTFANTSVPLVVGTNCTNAMVCGSADPYFLLLKLTFLKIPNTDPDSGIYSTLIRIRDPANHHLILVKLQILYYLVN